MLIPMNLLERLLLLVAMGLAFACAAAPPASERFIPRDLSPELRADSRRLPLDGAHNFRDLGGYETVDGRRTRWGLLYRSDKLADLSDEDLRYLERLEIRRVIDFRSDGEREREPDRLPVGAFATLLPIEGEGVDPNEIRRLLSEDDPKKAEQLLVAANESFVTEFAPQYRAFLLSLADGKEAPTVFHCTAGKDRAGFAAALALMTVGVPRETIMQDYLLTGTYAAELRERTIRQARILSLGSVNAESMRALFDTRPEYLQAAFDAIDREYGGTENYLAEGLGISDAQRRRIEENLLDPVSAH